MRKKIRLLLMVTLGLIIGLSAVGALIDDHFIAPNPALALEEIVEEEQSSTHDSLRYQIVTFAQSLLGTPYQYAGADQNGFDCSGFVHYVFKNHEIALSRSSRLLAEEGYPISPDEAQPGDLIFFTGTSPDSREVGHVGIVVSEPGEEISFIHASSARTSPEVKYDSLEKPNYQRRFLMVRRVLYDLSDKNS